MSCTSCNSSICSCSCDVTSLPTGSDGLNGYNAYTKTTATFIVPLVGNSVTISVTDLGQFTGEWAYPGQVIYIEGAGYYEVVTSTTTQIVAENLGYPGNAALGTNINNNAGVSPGGLIGATGPSGSNGTNGTNGISITWLGSFASAPVSPTLNQAYYNTVDGKSYIWNGSAWTMISQDGAAGPQGPTGLPGGLMHYNISTPGATTQFLEVPYTPSGYYSAVWFVYPGKLYEKTPKTVKVIAKSTLGEGVLVVDIYDQTNTDNWNATTTINPVAAASTDIYTLSTLSLPNIYNNEALIEIQISNTEPDTVVTVYGIYIQFQ